MTKRVISPLSKNYRTEEIWKFDSEQIIKKYKHELNIDVSDYFNNVKEIVLFKCRKSGLKFYYPTIEGDGHFYKKLSEVDWYYPKTKWEHFEALKNFPTHGRLLEVGCGRGDFLKLIISEKPHLQVEGLEINPEALITLKQKKIKHSSENLNIFADENKNQFDVVCCFQVLEHVSNPKTFIEECLKLLKTGGLLICAVPNNNPYLFGFDMWHTLNMPPHHQLLWNKKSVLYLEKIVPIKILTIDFEPQSEKSLRLYLKYSAKYYFKYSFFEKIIDFLPNIVIKLIIKTNWIKGRNLLFVGQKD